MWSAPWMRQALWGALAAGCISGCLFLGSLNPGLQAATGRGPRDEGVLGARDYAFIVWGVWEALSIPPPNAAVVQPTGGWIGLMGNGTSTLAINIVEEDYEQHHGKKTGPQPKKKTPLSLQTMFLQFRCAGQK
ncbi:unnamed protein product [Ostreobium quekettii]|uniref:Uncharacterized protein n=1 Tax=Ostreobium quekettii TaxID=121088 RepID=A0A8S1IZM0_9CHLO|nr:unnamed protein product [Ostreobium quekettii]